MCYNVAMTTREYTANGLLKAGAILTRSGAFTYTRGELGLAGNADEAVTVTRTLETLAHPQTLASLRAAPITIGHEGGQVTPDNWKERVVGTVVGEPRIAGDVALGDVLIGDKEALKRLNEGIDELSVDYGFTLGADLRTVGPLIVDNIAIVPRGRAGSSVRVLDSLEDEGMEKQEIMDAVVSGIDMAMQKHRPGMGDAFDMEGMKKSFMDSISPVLDAMKEMKDAQDKAITAADQAKAEADAKAAGEALVTATRTEERERFAVLTDAMPLIAEDKRAALLEAEPKAILVAALGDIVPGAEAMSVDRLRGALDVAKTRVADANNGLPAGVKAFDSAHQVTATDARAKAQADYEAMISKRYTDAGGV